MQLTTQQIEKLGNPEADGMLRALRWIAWMTPMHIGAEYRISAGTVRGKRKAVGYIQELEKRRVEYWEFLKRHSIEPSMYDKTIGRYDLWCAKAK